MVEVPLSSGWSHPAGYRLMVKKLASPGVRIIRALFGLALDAILVRLTIDRSGSINQAIVALTLTFVLVTFVWCVGILGQAVAAAYWQWRTHGFGGVLLMAKNSFKPDDKPIERFSLSPQGRFSRYRRPTVEVSTAAAGPPDLDGEVDLPEGFTGTYITFERRD